MSGNNQNALRYRIAGKIASEALRTARSLSGFVGRPVARKRCIDRRVFQLQVFILMLLIAGCEAGIGGESSATTGGSSSLIYTIGGNISGLSDAIVLRSNEKGSLALSTNGALTLSTRIARESRTGIAASTVSSSMRAIDLQNRLPHSRQRPRYYRMMDDPLLQNQWHIQNVGQDAFSTVPPVEGNDLNVTGAWAAGYSGKGIKVGIVDSGLEAAHEDLAANVDIDNSFNFLTGLNDPSPDESVNGFDHGTAVAGIIGSVAFNGKGGRGIAYDASLRGYNLLSSYTVANMAKSFGSDPISADNDVFNASFGNTARALQTFSETYQAITRNTMELRGGLGAAIINAAGNDFEDWQYDPGSGYCDSANYYGVSCGDPATDIRRGGYAPIIVGAINADGKHASYSNTGSSLWISAPGGEYGLNSEYTSGSGSDFDPAIITTSRTGCVNSIYPYPVNPLDSMGENPFASECQYTATMNGTSAATPNVTGVVALMLEANPNLSVRDLKYILGKTAKKVDASFSGVSSIHIISGSTIVLEQGWVTNSAGWSFSNRYGFGAVDASAAVAMAESYTEYLPDVQSSEYQFLAAPPATITPYSSVGNSAVMPIEAPFTTVEFVVVFLNISLTPNIACNQVELTSPSGTKSILMHAANGFSNFSVNDVRFLSNAFYGEPANGNWILTFYDFCLPGSLSTQLSTVNPQVLFVIGH